MKIFSLFSRVSFQPWKLRSLEILTIFEVYTTGLGDQRQGIINKVFLVLPVINSLMGHVITNHQSRVHLSWVWLPEMRLKLNKETIPNVVVHSSCNYVL